MADDSGASRLDRRRFVTGIGAAMAAGLAGCSGGGGGDGGGDGDGGGGGGGAQDLDFWMFGGIPAEREYVSSHYQNYGENNVTYEHQEWGQKFQILASASANQNLPDVFAGQGIQIPDYAGADVLQPVDQDPWTDPLEDLNSNFIQANVQALTYEGLGDTGGERQWGVPGGYADLGPFIDIRSDYLEQTSFDRPPRTWPEFIQMAEEMQEIDEVSAAVTASGTDFGLTAGYFIGFVWANGGRYFDPETLEATVNEPGFVDAVKVYEELASKGLFPGSIAENNHIDAGRLLREGESGMFITYSHANAVYQTTGAPQPFLDGEGHVVTRAPLPENPSGRFEPKNLLLQNAQAFMMGNGTANDAERNAAFDFIEWWNQPEQLAPWTYTEEADVGIRGRVPTLTNAFENPSDLFKSQFGDLITLYNNDNLFNKTTRFPSFAGLSSVQSIINTMVIQPVATGQMSAQEACDKANPEVQKAIDENLA